jgi:hypothetical protein
LYVPSRAWRCLCMVLIKGGLTMLIDVVKQALKGNSRVLLTSVTYTYEFEITITKIPAIPATTALVVAAATAYSFPIVLCP